ncbi:MAG: transporter ATP-binding protein [Phycisphaerales bacterium]|nr:transporter ATP-binding protein [Phycisphaerales bacterium]
MFEFVAVSKAYNGQPAVEDVSFALAANRTTVLMGPSGSGKSTILGLMTGLLKPTTGVIKFEGEPLAPARLPLLRRRIGYVVQDGGLFPHLTCLANVTLMARHIGWRKSQIDSRVADLASLARLSPDVLARYPLEVSGGQRQRVSLMRALMLDADVLLLDEPLGSLDPMVRAELQGELAGIFRRLSKTVLLVTHDVNEAAFFADQLILMRAGKIVQTGSPEDLFDRPTNGFTREFVLAGQSRVRTGGK